MSDSSPTGSAADEVRAYVRSIQGDGFAGQLPPHYPTCLGCGPEAEHGFHLQVIRDGDDVVATHVFTHAQSGAPGIAHGGAVATVVDDVLGFCLYLAQLAAVTRHLEVEYRKPVLLGVPYEVRARVDSLEGRKLWVSCTGTADGVTAFTARGLFLQVPLRHFDQGTARSGDAEHPTAP